MCVGTVNSSSYPGSASYSWVAKTSTATPHLHVGRPRLHTWTLACLAMIPSLALPGDVDARDSGAGDRDSQPAFFELGRGQVVLFPPPSTFGLCILCLDIAKNLQRRTFLALLTLLCAHQVLKPMFVSWVCRSTCSMIGDPLLCVLTTLFKAWGGFIEDVV